MKRLRLKTVLIPVAFVAVGIVCYPKIHRDVILKTWSSSLGSECESLAARIVTLAGFYMNLMDCRHIGLKPQSWTSNSLKVMIN
jgi:hypothetical protein